MAGMLNSENELAAHASYCTIQFFYYILALGNTLTGQFLLGEIAAPSLLHSRQSILPRQSSSKEKKTLDEGLK